MILEFESSLLKPDLAEGSFGHEYDNSFVSYGIVDNRVVNEVAYPPQCNYNNLTMQPTQKRLTAGPVTDYGIKTFPRFGAFGFFTSFYDGLSKVLIPIKPKNSTTNKPSVQTSISGNSVTFTITSTDPYDCYRIVARKGFMAAELVTYDTTVTFDIPYTGLVDLSVVGHKGEISTTSLPWETQITI